MKRFHQWLSLAVVGAGAAAAAVACGNGDDTSSGGPGPASDAGKMDGTVADDGGGKADAGDTGTGDAGASDAGSVDGAMVTFAIDFTKGPARQFQPDGGPQPVSPLVYGVNVALDGPALSVGLVDRPTRWGMVRQGGDALTSYNWTNNYNNAGSDYCFYAGSALGGAGAPAGFLGASPDGIPAAQAKGEPTMVTVPIVDFVAGAVTNTPTCPATGPDCSGGTTTTVRVNSGDLTFATADAASPAFVPNVASKPDGGYCTCIPDAGCASGCTPAASPVYEDEFVNFLRTGYADGGAPVLFSLDNEPNYWGGTHPDLWPSTGTVPCQDYTVTFDDIVSRNVKFATAVKTAWPAAKVFGPVVAQDGVVYAHDYNDQHLPTEFLDYYLAQMASASTAAGHPLLDVLDVHYYTNNGNPSAAQCMQSPRLFWDPNYKSLSATATSKFDFGWTGPNAYFNSTSWYPRKYVPRLLAKIAAAFPGANAPGLSISEYNNGCESTIAGGVAQADVLGVFGREGVYAAAVWPLQDLTSNYLLAAFDLYRNFDGSGSTVGDTAVLATTSDSVNTSVYAFAHSDDPNAIDVVAVNKATSSTTASMTLAGAQTFTTAATYVLQDGNPAVQPGTPVSADCTSAGCTMTVSLPPTSATTFVVRATH